MRATSTEAPLFAQESGSKKRPALRLWFLATVLGIAAFFGWLLWPSDTEISPYDLSRADGKSRLYATTYSKMEMPRRLPLPQRLLWTWTEYQRRHAKAEPRRILLPCQPGSALLDSWIAQPVHGDYRDAIPHRGGGCRRG